MAFQPIPCLDMKTGYSLNALEGFACLADKCPASCCSVGWDIKVEREVYDRWAGLPDESERTRLLAAAGEQVRNGETLLLMRADEKKCCPLLSADGLCSLQIRHGIDYMPAICLSYPRSASETRVHAISLASLSCPEIARRVLFPAADQPVFRKSPARVSLYPEAEDSIRHTLTELVDHVMAEVKYPVATRVYYLGDFITRMSRLSMQQQLNPTTLNQAAANFKQDLYQTGVAIKEKRLRPDPAVAGSFWHSLFRIGRSLDLVPEPATPTALGTALVESPAERAAQYTAAYTDVSRLRRAALPQLQSYESHFVRYLHVALFHSGFPWQPVDGNYIASLIRALLPFALVRLRLWIIAERGALGDADVLDAVYKIERAISHSKWVLKMLDANPELLELDRYHTTLVDL